MAKRDDPQEREKIAKRIARMREVHAQQEEALSQIERAYFEAVGSGLIDAIEESDTPDVEPDPFELEPPEESTR